MWILRLKGLRPYEQKSYLRVMLSKFIPSFIRTVLTGFIRVTVGLQECDFT